MFWMMCLILLFEKKRVQIILWLGISFLVFSLYITESIYPHLIQPYYPDPKTRIIDLTIGLVQLLSR